MTSDRSGTIRVFLVDDQQMVRAGFRMLVDSQDDMEVVGDAGDGAELYQQYDLNIFNMTRMSYEN